MTPRYAFLVETYETEIWKVLSVWRLFRDEDASVRPHPLDRRGRSVQEQMVHQCVSEDIWFRTMLGVEVDGPVLPEPETAAGFIEAYARAAGQRLAALRERPEEWWEEETGFFETRRSHAWVLVRRVAHTAHHRGQQTALLRMLGRDLHSTYGPTADTGGLMRDHAPVIYAYGSLEELLAGGPKAALPGAPAGRAVTERPEASAVVL